MKILGLAGWSGVGKTSLLVKLLPELRHRGLSLSTIKHAHHSFDIDQEGKDSFLHRQAGAKEVMVASAKRWALMHEHHDEPEPRLQDLLARMAPVDLILVEGFKGEAFPKLEIYRPELGKPFLAAGDNNIIAIATNQNDLTVSLPVLPLGNVKAIGDFIVSYSNDSFYPPWPN